MRNSGPAYIIYKRDHWLYNGTKSDMVEACQLPDYALLRARVWASYHGTAVVVAREGELWATVWHSGGLDFAGEDKPAKRP